MDWNQRLAEAEAQCGGEIHSVMLKWRPEPPPRMQREKGEQASVLLCKSVWGLKDNIEGPAEVEKTQKYSIHME